MVLLSKNRRRTLPGSCTPKELVHKRYVTLILRLVVDRRGTLVHGEIAEINIDRWTRFVGWRGLPRAIREILETVLQEDKT